MKEEKKYIYEIYKDMNKRVKIKGKKKMEQQNKKVGGNVFFVRKGMDETLCLWVVQYKKKEDYFTISPEFQLFRSFVSMGQGKAQQSHVLLYHLSYDESMKTSQ